MKDLTLKHYIQEISCLLKENAKQAKLEVKDPKTKDSLDYNIGYLMAYHEVITIMKNQAYVFNIDQKEIELEDIEPDRDLV